MAVSAIVLAAGEGSRMRSTRPKPLHMICGRPIVMHVIHADEALEGTQPLSFGRGLARARPQGVGVPAENANEGGS